MPHIHLEYAVVGERAGSEYNQIRKPSKQQNAHRRPKRKESRTLARYYAFGNAHRCAIDPGKRKGQSEIQAWHVGGQGGDGQGGFRRHLEQRAKRAVMLVGMADCLKEREEARQHESHGIEAHAPFVRDDRQRNYGQCT